MAFEDIVWHEVPGSRGEWDVECGMSCWGIERQRGAWGVGHGAWGGSVERGAGGGEREAGSIRPANDVGGGSVEAARKRILAGARGRLIASS
jgi:hypothetical protein